MRVRVAAAAIIGLSMTTAAAPAVAGGPSAAAVRGTAYTAGQIQHISPAGFKRELRHAKGVGLVQKLRVAASVQKFTEDFYWFHKGKGGKTLAQLRARFDTLHRYITGLVAAKNPALHAALIRSREALWRAFANRRLFAAGFGRGVIKRLDGHDPQLAANQLR